jgi:outer membrane receptor protein involved in Fe transport
LKYLVLQLTIVFFLSILILPQERRGGNFPGKTLTGKVFDSATSEPIEYVNIVIYSQVDSSLVTGGVTNSEGFFNISMERAGRFYVEIKFIGYDIEIREAQLIRGRLNVDLGEISIHPSAVNLSDVVVEGERLPITYQIDKKVVNPDQMLNVISGNATDILQNVPSVQVDIEGNVSLRGSQSFIVLIDGRPSVLDAQDALQQIAASSIDKIEIITNPSAKYDPEGTAGIINIIMKKSSDSGLSGIVNANAGKYDSYGGDFLINYQASSLKINLGFDYNQRTLPGNNVQNNLYFFEDNTSTVNSTGDIDRERINYEGRGGVEFALSPDDLLSFGARLGRRERQNFSDKIFTESSVNEPDDFNYLGLTDRSRSGNYYALNSNYSHTFGIKGHLLLGELFYSYRNSDEFTITSEFSEEVQFSGKKTTEFGPSTDFRGKLDYIFPFSEFSKFEAGYQGEVDISEETNELYEFNPDNADYEFQSQYSNLNKYNRSEHALYSIYSNWLWEIQLQAGLRAEFTYRTIEVPTQNKSTNLDRIDYFPSLHSSYEFTKGRTVMASYSRRIDRPRGWALEPFDTWIDANNVRRGNPELQPEFIDSYESGFQTFLGEFSLTTEIYYRVTHNKIERVRSAIDENVSLTTFENVGTDYSLGAEAMLNFDPFNFWNVNLMGNVYNYLVEGILYEKPFSQESFNWQSRFNNNFKIGKSTQIQFNLNYNSPTVSSQGRWEGYFRSDLSVRQEIIENVLAATLQARDLFGTRKREFTSEGENFSSYNYYSFQSPVLMLNLRYTFNNFKPERKRGEGGGGFEGGEDF